MHLDTLVQNTMYSLNKLKLKLIVNSLIILPLIVDNGLSYMPIRYVQVDPSNRPQDCADVLNSGNCTSGIYKIWPRNRVMNGRSIEVYCDMATASGGWTGVQRRGDFNSPTDFFYKDWESYKKGFGDLEKDFWLGNDNIFAISNQKEYSVRFDLRDFEGNRRYAEYDTFWIDDEYHKYMLHIKGYSGDAGDSMYPYHDQQKFSTKDQRNDNRNSAVGCAVYYKGAWWYNACLDSNLNGLYLRGKHGSPGNGIDWKTWKGHSESLARTEIKLRPKDFWKNYRHPCIVPPPMYYRPSAPMVVRSA